MPALDLHSLRFALFDWDNTLAESRSSLVAAVDKVLAEYHLPPWSESQNKRDRNLSFKDNFPNIFGERAEEAYARYRQIYLSIVDSKISAFPSAAEVLTFLQGQGIKLIIVTNKERCLLEHELPLLYDAKLFSNIVCGHEAPADKPSGEQIRYALKDYLPAEQISPHNSWMIGDSPQDSTAAHNAGAQAIRVHSPIWGEETHPATEDIIRFPEFSDFLSALKLAKN